MVDSPTAFEVWFGLFALALFLNLWIKGGRKKIHEDASSPKDKASGRKKTGN